MLAVAIAAGLIYYPLQTFEWNLVIVTIDTTRADHLGCYGYPHGKTPTLDRLAAQGLRYEVCYASVPLTLPSHSTIMTGLYPFTHGVHNNGTQVLDESAVTLAEVLAGRGYRTGAIIGAFVLDKRFGLAQGFECYDDDLSAGQKDSQFTFLERNAEQVTDAALAFLGKRDRRPYFLWVHYFDPHADYAPPGHDARRSTLTPYDAEIAYSDQQLKRLVHALDSSTRRKTLLVVTSDHGEGLWEHGEPTHGTFIYNSTMLVPLIVRFPEGRSAGRVVTEPVALADIFPSVLKWLDVQWSGSIHGRLLPTASPAKGQQTPRAFYLENYAVEDSFGWSRLQGVVWAQQKLIEAPTPELYNLAEDTYEQQNLASSQTQAAQRLSNLMNALLDDPSGPRPLQAGKLQQDPQALAKMQALGYLGTPPRSHLGPAGPDPKEMIDVLHQVFRIQTQIENEHYREAAEQLITILRDKDPCNVRCLWLLADLAPRAEVRSLAAELLQEHRQGDLPSPLDFLVPAKLGLALAGLERYAEAADAFRQALAVQQDSASVHVNLASALELLNRPPEEYLPHLKTACTLEPENAHYALRLAKAYERLGEHDKAQGVYERIPAEQRGAAGRSESPQP